MNCLNPLQCTIVLHQFHNFLVSQDRAKIQAKRRPPTRQARRAAAATASASDVTLFGSTPSEEASASARASWPGGLPSLEGLGKSEVDSGFRPSRTGTTDSDMGDEFFGFTGSRSKVKTEEPSVLDDPLAGGLFSTPASKPEASKANEPFSDDSDIFSISSEKNKKESAVVSDGKISADEDDLFSVNKTKEESKTKVVEPLGGKNLFGSKTHENEDIFSSVSDEKKIRSSNQKTPSKAEEPKISSPLDNDHLFSVRKDDKSVEKTKGAQPSKTEAKPVAKEKKPSLDEDFSSNSAKNESKTDKKETEKPTKTKAFSSPLGEDDDLFAVSAPVKKDVKSTVDSATKKTASPVTNKKTTPKATAVLDVSTCLRVSRNLVGGGGGGVGSKSKNNTRLLPQGTLALVFSKISTSVNNSGCPGKSLTV